MYSYFYYAIVVFIISFLSIHLNSTEILSSAKTIFAYSIDQENSSNNILSSIETNTTNIFQISNNLNQYQIIKVKPNIGIVSSFTIPEDTLKEEGYITYPQDGSFFLWYPVLGSKTRVYDPTGHFLWETPESRYLYVDAQAKWILAVSGDQSGVEFLRPNFKPIVQVEGSILFGYQFNEASNDNEFTACLGFLNGTISFLKLNTDSSIVKKINTYNTTKGMGCNFKNNTVTLQTLQKSKDTLHKNHDVLVNINLDDVQYDARDIAQNIKPSSTIDLPEEYPYSLPIKLNPISQMGAIVLASPTLKTITVAIFNQKGIVAMFPWGSNLDLYNSIDDFRIDTIDNSFLISSPNYVMLLNENNVLLNIPINNLEKTIITKNIIALKYRQGIMGIQLSQNANN